MKKLFAILSFLVTTQVFAGGAFILVPDGTSGSKEVTRAYTGLKWTMGKGATPDVVVGVRSAKVKTSGKANGSDLSVTFDIKQGIKLDQVRLKYFDGKERNQNEVSLGYAFNKGVFGGVSYKAPYANLGLDLFSLQQFDVQPWVIFDTHNRYKKPVQGSNCVLDSGDGPNGIDRFPTDECVNLPG